MRGKLAVNIMPTSPDIYHMYITVNKKGETSLYFKAINAIYGIIKAELLFHKNCVGNIITIGFNLNPYESCVSNKIINGRRMTVIWNIGDLDKNGKSSISKSKKKINTICLITNPINQFELEVKYCPTEDMIADYFTKYLQGKPFMKFCKYIMNLRD